MTDDLSLHPELEDRLRHFQNLMPYQVQSILLVASPYDSFLLKEDGQLNEIILNEFLELNLRHVPGMRQVSTGAEALKAVRTKHYDLVITTPHVGDVPLAGLVEQIKEVRPDLPIVLLAFDEREFPKLNEFVTSGGLEQVFVWHGDFRILLAIVKYVEDRWNVRDDVRLAGVSVIILIEDSVRYYSSFLPMLYAELFRQSERVVAEGVNITHKVMRMRARPKILLCTSYEEALAFYREYRDHVLGIISDVDFPRDGKSYPEAGLDFARMVRQEDGYLPIMLQTRDESYRKRAQEVNAEVVFKHSLNLLSKLRRFILVNFGFGDFVFRRPDGTEIGRAENLRAMESVLRDVPEEAIYHHASLNNFSTWLRARTEFGLAEKLKVIQVSDFDSTDEMREFLISSIYEFRRERHSGIVVAYDRRYFDPEVTFAKIGTGSLGGKARGLAFVRDLLYNHKILNRFPGVQVMVPAGVVLATDIFDQFVEDNDLREFALTEVPDEEVVKAFLIARFPKHVLGDLYRFLDSATYPLAVRSSSLLEDSQHQPFAGIYRTIMCSNNHPNLRLRRREVVRAIKLVMASVFSERSKAYVRGTPYRLEEEKMAVIVQRLGGERHGSRFYPEIAGVARSHNFYPVPPMTAQDGVVSVALGLGKTVVEGGNAVRFCPRYPDKMMDAVAPDEVLDGAQTRFYALDMTKPDETAKRETDSQVKSYPLDAAEEDGTLSGVASVYSPDNLVVYDGLGREGIPFVSMAPVLHDRIFPLVEIVRDILEIGERGLNLPVEVEFAANLTSDPREFYFLQMRPMVVSMEAEQLRIESIPPETVLVRSGRVLGSGRIEGIRDLVFVDRDGFDPSKSKQVAVDVAHLNTKLTRAETPYVLIGIGRWGSSEPWLGIPVRWEQIAGARVIVEADYKGKHVAPSQGSHFFHNLTASLTGYFTANSEEDGFVDWAWLREQQAVEETPFVRHLRLDEPLTVIVDGSRGAGVIQKPGTGSGSGT